MLDVTFSVVSHGQGSLLQSLLGEMDAAPSLRGAQVVVTLNLPDETFDVAPYGNLQIELIRNEVPAGFGANHNRAFASCRKPWFVILNPDLRLAGIEPFTALVARAASDEQIAVVAPRVESRSGAIEDSVRSNLTPWSLLVRHLLRRRSPVAVAEPARIGRRFYWVAGMCLCVNAAAFRIVGGFDERFHLYCEDYDLCARLYNRGYAIVVEPRARIVHDARRGSHRSIRYLGWHLSSLVRVWLSKPIWQVYCNQRR
jgi:GT2 family glycosyltransferase